ncbi:putative Transmembrane protein [Melia azedarach]|uniref:Transmembrane protein n=1 Tax=Melia azedarach TaxID=155640 RepID=A0ACC1YH53_MELAZ|nr:putative Transmembrane protein [Melia azedarach]
MEIQQSWRVRLSFKNATILITILNVLAALILLQGFLSSFASSRDNLSSNQLTSVQLKYIKESEEMRLAMQPLELIKRVREIQQEAYTEPEIVVQKDAKQTAAVDVSKRLKDLRSVNDAASIKALEEWRKRKMERARQRQLEKNGTTTSQA